MSRLLMFGEAPNITQEQLVIHDGVPSASTRVSGIGTTPLGNVSVWAHRVLEDQRFYPTLLSRQFAPAATEAWMRFHFFANNFNRAGDRRVFGLRLGNPGSSVPILNFVQRDNGANFLFGPRLYSSTGGILGEIASNLISTQAVYLWEVHVRLDGTNGLFELFQNGTLIFSYAGPLSGPSGQTTFDTFCFGAGVPLEGADPGIYDQGTTNDNSARYTIDNFALNDISGTINNGRIGDGVIIRAVPSGNGGFSQLTNANGNSIDNYKHAQRGAEGWVYPTAVGQRDSYVLTPLDPEFGSVNALMWRAQAAKNGPTIGNVRFSLKPVGQSDFQAAGADAIPPEATADFDADTSVIERIIETNPNTASGFTISEVDGCEAGLAFEA